MHVDEVIITGFSDVILYFNYFSLSWKLAYLTWHSQHFTKFSSVSSIINMFRFNDKNVLNNLSYIQKL